MNKDLFEKISNQARNLADAENFILEEVRQNFYEEKLVELTVKECIKEIVLEPFNAGVAGNWLCQQFDI